MASTIILCPNQHENLGGLSHCRACGLPLLDLPAQFESLAASLSSRADMGRPSPRAVLVGLGTAGVSLIEAARANGKRWGGSKQGRHITVTSEQIQTIQRLKADGEKIAAIGRATGLSRPTIYRALRAETTAT